MRTAIWHSTLGAAFLAATLAGEPATAHAQDEAAVSEGPKVRITKKDCRRLMRHRPAADVAYQPGVDVRGNKVVGADLNGGFTVPLPDVFEFNVTKDLSKYIDTSAEQAAADRAAALAASKSLAATDAAVSSAELSLAGAQTQYDTAAAAATAAQAAADAAPNDATLAAAAATAQAEADTAEAGLATTQSAYDATVAAATDDDVSTALAQSQAAGAAAEEIGYTPNATAQAQASAASQAAEDSAAADADSLAAAEAYSAKQEEIHKSTGMNLNVGTVRYNVATGAMTFNGKPLTDASEAELAAQCAAMLKGK